jgi:hypothetical protein
VMGARRLLDHASLLSLPCLLTAGERCAATEHLGKGSAAVVARSGQGLDRRFSPALAVAGDAPHDKLYYPAPCFRRMPAVEGGCPGACDYA